jgi:hypothetical protein
MEFPIFRCNFRFSSDFLDFASAPLRVLKRPLRSSKGNPCGPYGLLRAPSRFLKGRFFIVFAIDSSLFWLELPPAAFLDELPIFG